jgi:hypothetical protein
LYEDGVVDGVGFVVSEVVVGEVEVVEDVVKGVEVEVEVVVGVEVVSAHEARKGICGWGCCCCGDSGGGDGWKFCCVMVKDGAAGMDSSAAAAPYQPMTMRDISVMMEIRYSSCEQGQPSRLVRHSIVCLFSEMTPSMLRAWGGKASVPASGTSVLGSVQPDDALGNNRMRMSRAMAKQQVRGLLLKLLCLLPLLLMLLVLGSTQSKAETEEKA